MKLWLVCFFVLFWMAEGLQEVSWAKSLKLAELPLPLVVLGGVALAIAANYRPNRSVSGQSAELANSTRAAADPQAAAVSISEPPPKGAERQPQALPAAKTSSISFEIRKPQLRKQSIQPPKN
ncbi:MAG TPA: hypothetical protein V6D06_05710 [Trichocoleus sp.]